MRLPGLPSHPPIWREALLALELARLVRDPVYNGAGVSGADGQPVLLIPGFLAGDGSLAMMTQWLRRTGHWTRSAGIRSNVDCSNASVERLLDRIEVFAECRGERVALIGHSRGGTLARVIAVRRPDLVSGVIALGSPLRDSFALHPLVRAQIRAVATLGTAGAPGLFRHACRTGPCCRTFWDDLRAPFPEGAGYLSIYSKRDGIVDWRACLDPAAEHVEIDSTHIGMGLNAHAYRAVGAALGRFRAETPAARRARAARAPSGRPRRSSAA